MTQAEFQQRLMTLAEAWRQRDYATAAGFFSEDVRYADPLRYAHAGRAELRQFFEEDEGCEQHITWHHILFDEAQQLGAAEYTYEGSFQYHGFVLVRVANDQFTHWREYQHTDPRSWEDFSESTAF